MSEFWTLLFRYSFGLLCHSFILYLLTDFKYSRALTLRAWLGTFALTSLSAVPFILMTRSLNLLFVIEAVTSLAVYCAVYLCLSRGSVWRNLFSYFTYATFFLFSLTLCSCVSQMFFDGSHWATVAGRTIFLGLYTLWLVRNPPDGVHMLSGHLEKGWTSLAAFSVFSGLTVYSTALTFLILKVEVGIRLAVSMVLFLLIGSAYLVAYHTVVLMVREQEAQETKAQRRLLESHLATEQEFAAQAKTQRHDLHYHISLIIDRLDRGDIEGAKAHLVQYQTEIDADTQETYCQNTVANALLCHTARLCAGSAIPFTCRAVIPQTIPLTGAELSTVLGNVLENAWESSRRSEAPWIAVTARLHGKTLLVEVKNAVSGETKFEDDLPVSLKPGGGFGLKSANRVLEKYGGVLHCDRQGDTFFTQAAIPLQCGCGTGPAPARGETAG